MVSLPDKLFAIQFENEAGQFTGLVYLDLFVDSALCLDIDGEYKWAGCVTEAINTFRKRSAAYDLVLLEPPEFLTSH